MNGVIILGSEEKINPEFIFSELIKLAGAAIINAQEK